jgi:hypothetical protein
VTVADGYSLVRPLDHLLLTIAVVVFVACVAVVAPVVVASRRRTSTDAVVWADRVRRDDGAAWAADRVLRSIEATCARARVGFPGMLRGVLGPIVRLDLAAPTAAPPEPWTATPDGRSWSAPMSALQSIPLLDVPSTEFASVVTLGSGPDGTVLVDLRRANGMIAFVGDRDARRAVVRRIVDQLVHDPWSATTLVLAVGVRGAEVGPVTPVSVSEALAAVAADENPGVLVLAEPLSGADGRELARLLERPSGHWAVLVLRATPLARWTLDVGRDGMMTSAELGPVRWVDVALSEPVDEPTSAPDDAPAAATAGAAPAANQGVR